jgi:UDP-glucose 4-epimerase
MVEKKVLVIGGAGYIGSHVVKLLGERKVDTVILDNLSTGCRENVLYGDFIQGDYGDKRVLKEIFSSFQIDSIIHLGGSIVVSESVENPLEYYENNVARTLTLLKECQKHRVNRFIFSSTAAVYGIAGKRPVREDTPLSPINPYGHSKLMVEQILQDLAASSKEFRFIILRYFNVAGADPDGLIGQSSPICSHLIKRTCLFALGKLEKLSIYGTDYDTPDGTCIRDDIHVTDLADAHLCALDYLEKENTSQILNCGYGKGHSVKQIIETMKVVSGVDLVATPAVRRPGDPPSLVADSTRLKGLLNWRPKLESLEGIVESALRWEKIKEKRPF